MRPLRVQQRQCTTCIYRPQSPLNLTAFEAEIADPHMAGHFIGWRECHHAPQGSGICCAGFWARHKDHFNTGQLAQRLNLVEYVNIDVERNHRDAN